MTGRAGDLDNPDLYSTFSEYTDPFRNPEWELFFVGHTSPSISLCTGLMKARDMKKEKYNVVAFIGDGSLSGGVAFEGLDAAAALGTNIIIVVNDQDMAIAENHGSLYENLRQLRESNGTADNNYFKSLGYDYRYIAEGNNVRTLEQTFREVKDWPRPIVVHINTQKGEGYMPAEKEREKFHWMMPFNIGNATVKSNAGFDGYADETYRILSELMLKDQTLTVTTAATPSVLGFGPKERSVFGHQFWDLGIAEQCAVSASAAAVKGGIRTVFGVNATFLQRAYDQLIEDLALNRLPGVMLVFAAGVYGIPDATHLGFWDMAMLSNIPNIVYLAPVNLEEYEAMIQWSLKQTEHPVAIRVPAA